MKNVALVVVVLGLVACSNPRPVIVLTDTGTGGGTDSGTSMGHDTGPTMGHDTGPAMGGCSITVSATSFGSLSAGCFPRCSAATASAVSACTDGTCVNDALTADTTASTPWTANGMAATAPLDCAGCYQYQLLHCYAENGCRTEVNAFLNCDPMMAADMCDAQVMAVNTCGGSAANMAAINTCAQSTTMGVAACFP